MTIVVKNPVIDRTEALNNLSEHLIDQYFFSYRDSEEHSCFKMKQLQHLDFLCLFSYEFFVFG